jgi:hypothetical protein
MNRPCEGYSWPTAEQELLLKAALLTGEESIAAWKRWAAAVDFDLLDAGSQRLLPLLYRNLVKQGIEHPALAIYKGFYRMTWYKNQLLLHRLSRVLHLLDSRGIPAVLLKGAAMAQLYYNDWALRPMNDFDLLVPQEKTLQAVDLLCGDGWSPSLRKPDAEDLKIRHAVTLVDGSGMEFDLHWRVILEWGVNNFEQRMRHDYSKIRFNGIGAYALSPTDQFFHVLIHGARWNAVAPLRWIPDAMAILRQAGADIEWRKLIREAHDRNLTVAFRKTITYLQEQFHAPVPAEIMQEIATLKPSGAERLEFWMHNQPRGFVRDILFLWFMHARSSESKHYGKLLLRFPSFLKHFWKLPAHKSLVPFLGVRLIKKIKSGGEEESLIGKSF